MRYLLLHLSSFIPLLARAVNDGSKVVFACYFFATYVLLEQKEWNGHPISTWHHFQRRAEVALMWSMAIQYWGGDTWLVYALSLLPLAIIPWKVRVDAISYSVCSFVLFKYNPVQILAVACMVVAEHAKLPTQLFHKTDWHRLAKHRIGCRAVQLLGLALCYQTTWQQCVLVCVAALTKAAVWGYTIEPDATGFDSFATETPVKLHFGLYTQKSHTL